MGTFDNPSADKFGPPPGQERFEPTKPKRVRPWYVIPLGVLYVVATSANHLNRARGWGAAVFALVALGLGVADAFVDKRARDERRADRGDPYSHHQNITR